MGTSRNQRNPQTLRWRVTQAAVGGGNAPRAVSELFMAAGPDGWLSALASQACAAYAHAAASAVTTMPDLLATAGSTGVAVREIVDGARRAALDSAGYVEAGFATALAERALTRVLVARLQTPEVALSDTPQDAAAASWTASAPVPNALAAEQLTETVRQIALHLVHRDGPQLVGKIGGSADVAELARGIAEAAARAAQPGADVIGKSGVQAWADAAEAAWESARTLAQAAGPSAAKPDISK